MLTMKLAITQSTLFNDDLIPMGLVGLHSIKMLFQAYHYILWYNQIKYQ